MSSSLTEFLCFLSVLTHILDAVDLVQPASPSGAASPVQNDPPSPVDAGLSHENVSAEAKKAAPTSVDDMVKAATAAKLAGTCNEDNSNQPTSPDDDGPHESDHSEQKQLPDQESKSELAILESDWDDIFSKTIPINRLNSPFMGNECEKTWRPFTLDPIFKTEINHSSLSTRN